MWPLLDVHRGIHPWAYGPGKYGHTHTHTPLTLSHFAGAHTHTHPRLTLDIQTEAVSVCMCVRACVCVQAPGNYEVSHGSIKKVTGKRVMVVSDLDGTMVGDDAATLHFKQWWEETAIPR